LLAFLAKQPQAKASFPGIQLYRWHGMMKVLVPLAGCLLIATIGLYGYRWFSTPSDDVGDPVELGRQALHAATPEAREKAALDLARAGRRGEQAMTQVLTESSDSRVRAAVIDGLGASSAWESMPQLFNALESADPLVQARANQAITKLLGANFFFNPDDPPHQQAAAIRGMKAYYEEMKQNPPPQYRR
jgi:hypothetical protein